MIHIILFVSNSLLIRMKFCKQNIHPQEQFAPMIDQNTCPNLPQSSQEKPTHPKLSQEQAYRSDIEVHVLSSVPSLQHPHNYFHRQRDITQHMRGVLLNWLLEVHQKYHLMNETFFLTVRLIDEFLRHEQINRNRLQLVGIAAMWIAAKCQQTYQVPKMNNLERLCDYAYRASDILYMQGRILQVTGFSLLTTPSPLYHLQLLQNHVQLPPKDYALACYLLQASTFDLSLQRFTSNSLAYAVIYFLRKLRGYSSKDQESMKQLCRTNQHEIRVISRELCGLWQNAQHQQCLASLRNKYVQKQYYQVSKIRLTQRVK